MGRRSELCPRLQPGMGVGGAKDLRPQQGLAGQEGGSSGSQQPAPPVFQTYDPRTAGGWGGAPTERLTSGPGAGFSSLLVLAVSSPRLPRAGSRWCCDFQAEDTSSAGPQPSPCLATLAESGPAGSHQQDEARWAAGNPARKFPTRAKSRLARLAASREDGGEGLGPRVRQRGSWGPRGADGFRDPEGRGLHCVGGSDVRSSLPCGQSCLFFWTVLSGEGAVPLWKAVGTTVPPERGRLGPDLS